MIDAKQSAAKNCGWIRFSQARFRCESAFFILRFLIGSSTVAGNCRGDAIEVYDNFGAESVRVKVQEGGSEQKKLFFGKVVAINWVSAAVSLIHGAFGRFGSRSVVRRVKS